MNVIRLPETRIAPATSRRLGVARVSWASLLYRGAMAHFDEQLASLQEYARQERRTVQPRLEVDRPDARHPRRVSVRGHAAPRRSSAAWGSDTTGRGSPVAAKSRRARRASMPSASGPPSSTRPADRRARCQFGQRDPDVVHGHGLRQSGRQANAVTLGARVGDVGEELEELRPRGGWCTGRTRLRSRPPARPSRGSSRSRAGGRSRRSSARTWWPTPAALFRRQEVAGRGREVRQHAVVVPHRRTGSVDHDLGTRQRVGQTDAGDRGRHPWRERPPPRGAPARPIERRRSYRRVHSHR